jgi:hypothetical protein
MNLLNVRRTISPWIKNIRGWRTDRKIVIIESDDWGSIRMPSREVYEKCMKAGYRVDKIAYERYDSLASEEDLELLFNLLTSFKDSNGNHPIITANSLVANPDFAKIQSSGFQEYHYELVTETFKRYPKHSGVFDLWMKGKQEGVFFPQSHGREHLNVSMFMNALQSGGKDVLFGFKHGIPGIIPHGENPAGGNTYVESLKYINEVDKEQKLKIILEGLDLFKQLFGYRSESLIPPNYLWSPDYDKRVSENGVRFYQGNQKMKEPMFNGSVMYHTHHLGDKNSYGQYYLVRNALFEPSLFKKKINDTVGNCLNSISAAFTLNKPAVICSHRINYIGFINPENRDRNLKLLQELITKIQKKWPQVEFMTSAELGNLIGEQND